MSSDNVIDFVKAAAALPPDDDGTVTTSRIVKSHGDEYRVTRKLDRKAMVGAIQIFELSTGRRIFIGGCDSRDDRFIVTAAIVCWNDGVRHGRQQMCEEIQLPELQG